MKKSKIGIALGGGGAKGFAHLGVLKALEEKGITPDAVSGVSAGAIVGVFIAAGFKPDDIMELIKTHKFMDYAKLSLPVAGFFSLENFEQNIKKHLFGEHFSDLKLPFFVGVSNLNTGNVEYFNEGALIPAIQASCSIPVLFSPVKINGYLYVDGGLLDNIPYRPLVKLCEKVIAVNVSPVVETNTIENLLDVAIRTFELSVSVNKELLKNECDLLIEPSGLEKYNILDTSHAEELFEIGYQYCKKIDNIDNLLKKPWYKMF